MAASVEFQQTTTNDQDQNDLDHVINLLRDQPGSVSEVIIDEEKNFKGFVYQDEYMRNMHRKFPEIIMVDATYKLLDLRMPLYLLLAIDGDGISEIVGLFILAEETQSVIESAVTIFSRCNLRVLGHNGSSADFAPPKIQQNFNPP